MTREEYEKAYQEQRDQYAANILNQGWPRSQQAAQGSINAQAQQAAANTPWGGYLTCDTGDETDPKPVNEVYAPEVKIESEEEKQSRLWKLIQEFSQG